LPELKNNNLLDKTDRHTDILVKLLGYSNELKPPCDKLEVPVENVLKGMGMVQSDADEYLLGLIEKFILECFQLVEPRASYVFNEQIKFDLSEHKVIIEDTVFDTGKIVTSFLKKSSAVILFSVTCGNKVETLSKQLMKSGHGLEGLIVDLIGSELAESITSYLHNYIEEKLDGTGFGVTNRFSPGYCNWPVSDQHKLFSLLKGNNCGIELTPSSLMLPIKSVSGIFGIGPDLKRIAYKCMICNDEKCTMREK
jgi:hypothetical protein